MEAPLDFHHFQPLQQDHLQYYICCLCMLGYVQNMHAYAISTNNSNASFVTLSIEVHPEAPDLTVIVRYLSYWFLNKCLPNLTMGEFFWHVTSCGFQKLCSKICISCSWCWKLYIPFMTALENNCQPKGLAQLWTICRVQINSVPLILFSGLGVRHDQHSIVSDKLDICQ